MLLLKYLENDTYNKFVIYRYGIELLVITYGIQKLYIIKKNYVIWDYCDRYISISYIFIERLHFLGFWYIVLYLSNWEDYRTKQNMKFWFEPSHLEGNCFNLSCNIVPCFEDLLLFYFVCSMCESWKCDPQLSIFELQCDRCVFFIFYLFLGRLWFWTVTWHPKNFGMWNCRFYKTLSIKKIMYEKWIQYENLW